jgi:hypothetical protein
LAYAKKKQARLDDYLVLNTFMNRLFGMKRFNEFQNLLKNVENGFDDEGRSWVFNTLISQKDINPQLKAKLEEYDSNIKSYVDHINSRREIPIKLKYFQYLAVLFTEIFLDSFFKNPTVLMNDLTRVSSDFMEKNDEFGLIYTLDDLRKMAFWMATGSGKTLLFHINYLQFMRCNQGAHRIDIDNILLITPNESLSSQHISEMQASSIPCEIFQQQNIGPFSRYADHNAVKVIDIHKLTEEKKGQGVTVDIENFGRKNLIFVDEGHKGSGGQKWKYFRQELAKEGFTFEYSATFGQAVAASSGNEAKELLHKYGKSIIFDYSYYYFYNDGYGKEYTILNLKDAKYSENTKHTVMLANLLTLYEQKLIFSKKSEEFNPYNIEEPLWIFVGSKVQGAKNQSDILEVVRFLDLFLKNEDSWAVQNIGKILAGNSGLKDKNDRDIFLPTYPEQRLRFLRSNSFQPEAIYKDILVRIFHSSTSAPLHLINLKNAAGEIALRCGSDEYFGVINIGDDAQFIKLVDNETNIHTGKDDVGGSLFGSINQKNSNINLLIGAKKFIEGWNSWRVSNMGLLNIGKSEGTQIIQLFGRGVRLKGKNNTLKRSRAIEDYPPEHLHILEKLNIFGIEANYMDQFREYLEIERMSTENYTDIPIPIRINHEFLQEGLFYPYVEKKRFKKEQFFELKFDDKIRPVEVDLIPKVEIIESQEQPGIGSQSEVKMKIIDHRYLDLLDWNRIYFSLLDYRTLKSWNNIVFSKEALREIIEKDGAAYSLKCLDDDIKPTKFQDIRHLEEIAVSILKKYLQSYHNYQKNIWTRMNLSVLKLNESNGNFEFREFKVTINEKETELINAILLLKNRLKDENFEELYGAEHQIVPHVYFDRHLYQPLFVEHKRIPQRYRTIPAGLNEGERQFIEDLKRYVQQNRTKFSEHRKMFVLRNLPKKGIGFFIKTLNYFPDFIIWIKTDDKQRIIFADPKGLTHMIKGFEDDKIQLFNHIKDIETILAKKLLDMGEMEKIELDSYIISRTSVRDAQPIFGTSLPGTYEQHHILLQEEREKYIAKMLI